MLHILIRAAVVGKLVARRSLAMKKMLTGMTEGYLYEMGRVLYTAYKPVNSHDKAATFRVFVPVHFYDGIFRKLLRTASERFATKGQSHIYTFHSVAAVKWLLGEDEFLSCNWPDKKITSSLVCDADDHPFSIKYTRTTGTLTMFFSFCARNDVDNSLVILPQQRINN